MGVPPELLYENPRGMIVDPRDYLIRLVYPPSRDATARALNLYSGALHRILLCVLDLSSRLPENPRPSYSSGWSNHVFEKKGMRSPSCNIPPVLKWINLLGNNQPLLLIYDT